MMLAEHCSDALHRKGSGSEGGGREVEFDRYVSSLSKSELSSLRPARVIGRGSFGVVLLALPKKKKKWSATILKVTGDHRPKKTRMRSRASSAPSSFITASSRQQSQRGKKKSSSKRKHGRSPSGSGSSCSSSKYRNGVALKIMDKQLIRQMNSEERVVTELQVLQVLNHPFTIKLEFAYQTESRLFIGTEYAPGGELFSLMAGNGSFSRSQVRFYASQLLSALAYLHKLDIVYRDLKPENVTIAADGNIRLIDFGMAVPLNYEDHYNPENGRLEIVTSSGTAAYAATEVLKRRKHGGEADWWSLGVMIYEMAFACLPWYDEDTNTLCEQICTEPVPEPEDMTADEELVFDLVQGLLTKDQAARLGYNGAAEICQHPFFDNMDWSSVVNCEYTPPFVPSVAHALDTSHFHEEFTDEDPVLAANRRMAAPGSTSRRLPCYPCIQEFDF